MVLAGGLGSSSYVRESLQTYMDSLRHPNAGTTVIVPSQEPQLVVVRGLLLEQQQQLTTRSNRGILATRIARASYGVKVKMPYSLELHGNEDVAKDEFDSKQLWALNQIQWVIRKGDTNDPNKPLSKQFKIALAPEDTTRNWTATFVTSNEEAANLPSSMKQPGSTKLCSLNSNLTGVQQHELVLKEKRGTCFSKGRKWYICTFDIRAIVAPADLRFELWFGGHKFSGSHEPISVSWD